MVLLLKGKTKILIFVVINKVFSKVFLPNSFILDFYTYK